MGSKERAAVTSNSVNKNLTVHFIDLSREGLRILTKTTKIRKRACYTIGSTVLISLMECPSSEALKTTQSFVV